MSDSTTIREVVVDASPVKEEVVATPAKPEEPEVSFNLLTTAYWTSIVTPDAPPTNPATAAEYAALGPAAPAIAAINNWFRIKVRLQLPALLPAALQRAHSLSTSHHPPQPPRTAAPPSGQSSTEA